MAVVEGATTNFRSYGPPSTSGKHQFVFANLNDTAYYEIEKIFLSISSVTS